MAPGGYRPSVSTIILERIGQLPVLPELQAALVHLVEQDWSRDASLHAQNQRLEEVLMAVYQGLGGGDPVHVRPFILAWHTLRAALLHLDHLQDDDRELDRLFEPAASVSQRYNLILAYYQLALTMLDDLDASQIAPHRFRLVLRFWNERLLQAASGQQRDLGGLQQTDQMQVVLDHYEQAMKAKAGSIYAIGFGGTALLATDDNVSIEALTRIGEAFGTLLQFSDDVLDAADQSEPGLTLPSAYRTAHTASKIRLPPHSLQLYASFIYQSYMEQIRKLVAPLPPSVQEGLLSAFRHTFAQDTGAANGRDPATEAPL